MWKVLSGDQGRADPSTDPRRGLLTKDYTIRGLRNQSIYAIPSRNEEAFHSRPLFPFGNSSSLCRDNVVGLGGLVDKPIVRVEGSVLVIDIEQRVCTMRRHVELPEGALKSDVSAALTEDLKLLDVKVGGVLDAGGILASPRRVSL